MELDTSPGLIYNIFVKDRYYVTITRHNSVQKIIWYDTVRNIEKRCWREYRRGALAVELELVTFLNFSYIIE